MNTTIPSVSWNVISKTLYTLGMHQKTNNDNIINFLKELELVKQDELGNPLLTQDGTRYFRSKYILNDEETANKIIEQALLKHPVVSLIIQVFNGRGGSVL